MRVVYALMFLLASTFVVPQSVRAQDQPRTYPEGVVRIVLAGGTMVVGRIDEETDTTLSVMTEDGIRMTIPREQVRSVTPLGEIRYIRGDPNSSRLLFAPTARPMESGSGYVAAYELFFPFVAYGAGDRVILAGGVSVIPGLSGQLAYLAPKVTVFEKGNVSIAGGTLISTFLGDNDEDIPVFGLLYGVGTFGRGAASLSTGFAFGFADGEFNNAPAFMVGGELQVSNSVKLLSENYFLWNVDEGVLVSGGVRFFSDRLTADLGLFMAPAALDDMEGFPFLPWLGFAYNFGG